MTRSVEIIFGGPGTGKTTHLLNELDAAFQAGLAPERVAYVSFTRKGVYEAKDRARDRFGMRHDDLPYFRTLHSLGFHLLGLTITDMLGPRDFAALGDELGCTFSGRSMITEGLPSGRNGDAYLALIQYAQATRKPLESVWREAKSMISWFDLKHFYDTYDAYKNLHRKLDFSDVLDVAERSGATVDVDLVIIDEAQDLSNLQWAFVRSVFRHAPRILVAGDDDQAIYRWGGAEVERLLRLRGTVRVLPQSHRLPEEVFRLASTLTRHIRKRQPKDWKSTGKGGTVDRVASPDHLPLARGERWMLLARNSYHLEAYRKTLRAMGVPYCTAQGSSIAEEHITVISAWETLRKGREIHASTAHAISAYIPSWRPDGLPVEGNVTLSELRGYGLQDDRIWHDALTGIGTEDRGYYKSCLQNGYRLDDGTDIYVGTIHSAKGGEADNVALMTDMTDRSYRSFAAAPDDEVRVFYVGATRARERLVLVNPSSPRGFPFL